MTPLALSDRAPTDAHERDVARRFAAHWPRLLARLNAVYGAGEGVDAFVATLEASIWALALARPAALRAQDLRREASPDAVAAPGQTTYSFYVDRFAQTLGGLRGRLDYLADLGVRWLHPLPLLKPREGDSDGGFAVADYRTVDPRLGDMDDLEALATDLRARDMGLILDVVCNHTAREHPWAQKARAGVEGFADYYITLTAEEVAERERVLIDVFPDTAPGSFTYDAEMGGHVWTTFYPFQWDLNYANPAVFAEMLQVLVFLASKGVGGFRLDSAPYLWKAAGTTSRNRPQAYAIVEAWREALSIIAPSVVLVAEAIESLDDVLPFFGQDGRGCDLAYNNVVMTALWGALADADAGVFRRCLTAAARKPPQGSWLNYVRCHDDLIWNALASYASPEDLARWSGFYGQGQGFSRGRAFQTAPGGVPSTNGMASSLAGLRPGDDSTSPAVRRLVLLYGVIHALDGWPLIYMGDELALGDDEAYLADPDRAGDGRWLHRPVMDWAAAERRRQTATVEREVFIQLKAFGHAARQLAGFGVEGGAQPLDLGQASLLAFERAGGARSLLCLANLAETPTNTILPPRYQNSCDLLTDQTHDGTPLTLHPYQVVWMIGQGEVDQ